MSNNWIKFVCTWFVRSENYVRKKKATHSTNSKNDNIIHANMLYACGMYIVAAVASSVQQLHELRQPAAREAQEEKVHTYFCKRIANGSEQYTSSNNNYDKFYIVST